MPAGSRASNRARQAVSRIEPIGASDRADWRIKKRAWTIIAARYNWFFIPRVRGRPDVRHEPIPMNAFTNTVVTLNFKLFDAENALIEETGDQPIAYLHGGHSGIFPKVEAAIDDKKAGDKVSVTLEPVDAFGEYDAALIRIEPVASLPPDLTTGGYLVAEKDGEEIVFRVTSIADGKAVLDGNHELAGQRLRFDATIVDVRPATAEEITHGHVHGAHGHHH
jgi:FKBP-type peptidyl-prolyl cis-trans isomerase SlyD